MSAYTDDRPFSVGLVGAVSFNVSRFLRARDPDKWMAVSGAAASFIRAQDGWSRLDGS